MARTITALFVLLAVFFSAACAPAGSEGEDVRIEGETVFRTNSCAFCHTVLAAEPAGGPDAEPDGNDGSARLSDLSGAGATFTAEELRLFLVEGEEIDGRGHVMLFVGSGEEWAALSDWLLGFAASQDTSEVEMIEERTGDAGSMDTLRVARPPELAPGTGSGNGSD